MIYPADRGHVPPASEPHDGQREILSSLYSSLLNSSTNHMDMMQAAFYPILYQRDSDIKFYEEQGWENPLHPHIPPRSVSTTPEGIIWNQGRESQDPFSTRSNGIFLPSSYENRNYENEGYGDREVLRNPQHDWRSTKKQRSQRNIFPIPPSLTPLPNSRLDRPSYYPAGTSQEILPHHDEISGHGFTNRREEELTGYPPSQMWSFGPNNRTFNHRSDLPNVTSHHQHMGGDLKWDDEFVHYLTQVAETQRNGRREADAIPHNHQHTASRCSFMGVPLEQNREYDGNGTQKRYPHHPASINNSMNDPIGQSVGHNFDVTPQSYPLHLASIDNLMNGPPSQEQNDRQGVNVTEKNYYTYSNTQPQFTSGALPSREQHGGADFRTPYGSEADFTQRGFGYIPHPNEPEPSIPGAYPYGNSEIPDNAQNDYLSFLSERFDDSPSFELNLPDHRA